MIRLSAIIKYYLYFFLLIDAFSGFIRIYSGITNPIFNIGYWVRGPILVLLLYYYLIQLKKRKLFIDEFLALIIFAYFIFNLFLNYTIMPSSRMIIENIPYILRQQFLIFLLVYIRNRLTFSDALVKKVIMINFSVLTLNLVIGYFLGFGLESYRFSGTSKGMFQGGNPVSILNLVFFTFFLMDGALRKKFIPILLTFFNGFVIASKSIFGFIIPIFFALKRRYLSLNKIIFYNILAIIILFSFDYMSNKAVELYEKRFGLNISKSIAAAERVGGLYDNQTLNNVASINFRRYASMNIQMEESWKGFNSTIFGISLAGQNIFWEKRGEFIFRHASMDFFDFFFKYGIIGTVLFTMILFKNYNLYISKIFSRDGLVFTLFFLYAFFGGHVIDSVTSGSLFFFFLGKISGKNNQNDSN
jgi:hypothetical protein